MSTEFAVIRLPSLPEDEGKIHFLEAFKSKKEAEDFIKEYCASTDGYFNTRDFSILEGGT